MSKLKGVEACKGVQFRHHGEKSRTVRNLETLSIMGKVSFIYPT